MSEARTPEQLAEALGAWASHYRHHQCSEDLRQAAQMLREFADWDRTASIMETQSKEIERLRVALRQACDLWDADNLTTQTYLKRWREALGDE